VRCVCVWGFCVFERGECVCVQGVCVWERGACVCVRGVCVCVWGVCVCARCVCVCARWMSVIRVCPGVCVYIYACVCVCVCEREFKKTRTRETEPKNGIRDRQKTGKKKLIWCSKRRWWTKRQGNSGKSSCWPHTFKHTDLQETPAISLALRSTTCFQNQFYFSFSQFFCLSLDSVQRNQRQT